LKSSSSLKRGKFEGPFLTYHSNGQLKQKSNYKNGLMTGLYEEYYSNGQLSKKTATIDAVFNGPFKSYYKNGQIKVSQFFNKGILEGKFTKYFKNGDLKHQLSYSAGKPAGEERLYNGSGKLKMKTNWKNGKQDGVRLEYFDGLLREKTTYVGGDEEGPFSRFWSNTKLLRDKGTYGKNGLEGFYEKYFEPKFTKGAHILERKGHYKNGKETGVHVEYDTSGNKTQICSYKQGKKHGQCEEWKNGELSFVRKYLNGKYQETTYANPKLRSNYNRR
jgi:antitoxin component YwqK of YwqJK toxin-antitoxin module